MERCDSPTAYGLPVLNSQRRGQGDILLFLLVGRNERSRKDVTGGGGGTSTLQEKSPLGGVVHLYVVGCNNKRVGRGEMLTC